MASKYSLVRDVEKECSRMPVIFRVYDTSDPLNSFEKWKGYALYEPQTDVYALMKRKSPERTREFITTVSGHDLEGCVFSLKRFGDREIRRLEQKDKVGTSRETPHEAFLRLNGNGTTDDE